MNIRLLVCAMFAAALFGFNAGLRAQITTGIYVNSSNNVGIGTTTPQSMLQVAGSAQIRSTTLNNGFIAFNPGGADYAGYIDFYKPNSARIAYLGYKDGGTNNLGLNLESNASFNINGGNVGIGIGQSIPLCKLQVGGPAGGTLPTNTQLYLPGIQQNDGSEANCLALGVDSNANATMSIATRSTPGDLYPIFMDIQSGNTRLATFSSSGALGIGTPNPQQELQLSNAAYLGIAANGGSYIPNTWNRGNAGGIILSSAQNSDGSGWSYGSRIINNDYGNGLGLSFDVNYGGGWTNDVLFVSGRSSSLGNVGVGTTDPMAQLDVASILHVGGNTNPSLPGQGGYVGWNALTGGTGEMDFMNQQGGGSGGFAFFNSSDNSKGSPIVTIDGSGNISANSYYANTHNYADFVFKPSYKLPSLSEEEAAIKKEGHLPGIPSEAEAKAHGIDLAQMQVDLLQKVEELTLHQIEQEKQLKRQAARIDQLERENAELRYEVNP